MLENLVIVEEELRRTRADLKIVERDNLHFTVKFLGEITEGQAREVGERLKRLRLGRADVELRGVGAFPNVSRPNVIWVGVPQAHEERVRPIAQGAIAALEGIGESDKRPFTAHVTLGRVRPARGIGELTSVLRSNSDRSFGDIWLVELKLKSSVLGPRGPTYSDIGRYPLA